jgi:hypothetical protein
MNRCFGIGAGILLLATSTGFGAQTFVAFGLTNVTLGNAVYGPNPYSNPAINNLGANGDDGVSIFLGEADSGVFVYPGTYNDPPTGSFMRGHLYGSLNGESNRLICSMRANEASDGYHPVQIDFAPLGSTHFTFQLFRGPHLVAQTGPHPGTMAVYGNYFEPYYPRVNPFWRMRDGSVGAIIEFDTQAPMSLPGIGDISGDRVFIRAENPTNVVDFASRLDVTGGGGLDWFEIFSARPGVFNRSHLALADTLLQAHDRTLTLAHDGTNATGPGVIIELDLAIGFDVAFLPIELNTNSSFTVTGVGIGISTNEALGSVRIAHTGNSLELTAHLDIASSNTESVVYSNGVEVARATGTNATVPATARLIGAGLNARTSGGKPGIGLRLDQSVPVTLPNLMTYAGDEVRFIASNDAKFLALETLAIEATGLSAFTITNETEQAWTPPRLNIVRSGTQVELSWIDPNRIFGVEASSSLENSFFGTGATPTYTGDLARVVFEVDTEGPNTRFYRLSLFPNED